MIATPIILENDLVLLRPLESIHGQALWPIAQQVDLYRFGSTDVSSLEKLKIYIQNALQEASEGKSIPFIIYNKQTSEYVGSTRFGNIDHNNKTLHIGWTWISPEARGTGFNHQMKFLMLRHVFETMDFEKVEFRIDERNIVSRKAVEKLGATLEGILRKNITVKDGFRRSSCCYGILKEEWQNIKTERFSSFQ
ncbi:GNAT family N-acetyltransferase [Kriegella aquimaris]|uniref:Protein N-acetyltransferase, RimJ/RimL family n=1 Tax=Kriegella aquimaris TaxID=192904 RepID=A0A1G9NLR1_9FLAO|nr:GNAT family protein [Kriegella aquimaris]SDL87304.1 Protein N-acetyltransferase, RimJ/RimL family [Kriegella aquimaris]